MPEQLQIPAARVPPPGRFRAQFGAQVRAEESSAQGEPRATFTISTGDVARDGHVIEVAGWQLDNYRRNPVVLYQHGRSAGQIPVIGRSEEIAIRDGKLTATARFTSQDVSPFGFTVGRMVQEGFLHAASVGWDPIEWTYDEKRGGYNFIRQELLEWSVVTVPADAGALVQRAHEARIDLRPFIEQLARALDGDVAWSGVPRVALEQVARAASSAPVTVDLAGAFEAGMREAQIRAALASWEKNFRSSQGGPQTP